VLDRLRKFFTSQAEILDAFGDDVGHSAPQRRLFERAREIADDLSSQALEKIRAILITLVRRIEIRPDSAQIGVSRSRLSALLSAQSLELPIRDVNLPSQNDALQILTVPAKLKRVGRQMKMLIDRDNDRVPDPSLLRVIARAHDIQSRLAHNSELSVRDVAHEQRVTAAYIYTLLRLPWLAPDITTAIVNGRQPPQLNAKKLMRLTARLSSDWVEQRALLGFTQDKQSVFLSLSAGQTSLSGAQKSQPRNGR
jgi:site-specific DNA recombinase